VITSYIKEDMPAILKKATKSGFEVIKVILF